MLARALLFAVPLAVLFSPGIAEQVRRSADPYRFTDDAQQHYGPFICALGAADPTPCRDDYVFGYLSGRIPLGAHALYELGDPRRTGKVLPFLLYAGTLGATAAAALALGGPAAAGGALAIALADPAYFEHLSGALPRSFGLPLVALGGLGLVRRRVGWVATAAIGGAAFYLPAGILLAAALAMLLALESALPFRRRVLVLLATGAAMLALATPVLVAVAPYGPLIGPADVPSFPEAGPAGRMADGDRVTDNVAPNPVAWASAFLGDLGNVTTYWVQAGGLLALLLLAVRLPGARALLLLPLAMLVSHAAATLLLPALYVPGRYVEYAIPVITAIALPSGLATLATAAASKRRWARLATEAGVLVTCLWIGTVVARHDQGHGGLTAAIPEADRPLHAHLATLPRDALVAGWPVGPLEAVPYTTGRRVLVSREVHNPFHEAYVLELRRRTEALVDAYFAAEAAALTRLSDDFGVTHLLVDLEHYEEAPRYFAPFDARIREASTRPGAGDAAGALAPSAVWRDDHRLLLALRPPGSER